MSNTLERAAIAYATKFNWAIFPLKARDKTPLIPEWQKRATTDTQKIHKWWLRWPDANVAVACGLSNLVVVDLDVKEGRDGTETWRDLLLEHDIDDDTIIQLTPSGGQHIVYVSADKQIRNSNNKLGPGVDVRAEGGYIVLSPSILEGGKKYAWDVGAHPGDHRIAPLPLPLKALLIEGNGNGPQPAPPVERVIFSGQRNETLASLAGTMRRRGMSETAILAALHVENETKCSPALAVKEVERIARSVARYEPASQQIESVFPLTDLGNAERMATQHGRTLRFCHDWNKWLAWDGRRWAIDNTAEVIRRAKETARSLYTEAGQIRDDELRKTIAKWARGSESRSKMMAMIELSKAEYCMPIRSNDLDTNPWYINVLNGTLDLRTGKLKDHEPDDLITKLVPAVYEPTATCPLWLEFLERIMKKNQAVISFLQRAIGYSLTGDTREQVIFILYGIGANGKSTFLETLSRLLNDYALHTPTQTLMVKPKGSIPNDVARLRGARYVTAVEADEEQKLAESMIKQMTGGERMAARFLNAEWFEFIPEFKIWLATNHKPEIRGTDHAIWRRICLISFDVVIPDDEQDKDLLKKLEGELEGILNWALEGCLAWQKIGLTPPPEVLRATAKYRSEMDVLAGFIEDYCLEDESLTTTAAQLYTSYIEWCSNSGEKPLSKRGFGLRLKERGFSQSRQSGGTRSWTGIGLLDEYSQKGLEL